MTISAFFSDMPLWQQWAADTVMATALLMTLVLLLRRSVARLFGPQIAYLLWLVPALRLLMPAYTHTIEVEAAPLASLSNGDALPSSAIAANTVHDALSGAGTASAGASLDWLPIVLTLWLGGAALFLIIQLASYVQQRAEILSDGQQVDIFDNIKVIQVAGIDSPFAFGVFRRFIAIPLDFYAKYSPVEQQLALRHELAHHQARDLLANFAALTMLSLHWFNPLAWVAYRAFRFDQEAACDARVLASSDAQERHSYGRLIAKAATGRTLAFASPLTPKEKLCERLTLMTQSKKSPLRRRLGAFSIAGSAAAAMMLTATISYAYKVQTPKRLAAPAIAAAPADDRPVDFALSAPTSNAAPAAQADDQDAAQPAADKTVITAIFAGDAADKEKTKTKEKQKEKQKQKAKIKFVGSVNTRFIEKDGRFTITKASRGADNYAVKIRQEDAPVISEKDARNIVDEALSDLDFETLIPSIRFARDCSLGDDSVATQTSTVDGRTVMTITLCEERALTMARAEAIEGLREAKDELTRNDDVPSDLRKSILKILEREIRQLESQDLGLQSRGQARDI